MEIQKAVTAVKRRCTELGYDPKKVDTLYKQILSGRLYAFFPDVDTDGLTNDIATQAVPVAVVDEAYHVEMLDSAIAFFDAKPRARSKAKAPNDDL